ncbi:flavin-dependent monooxygenase oxygenase subunit HsaA [Arthrobacter ginkgonis]|uniref:Flavin-dependent monooxygenase oxygenase subunit HsaA n=1 Tax=Arthrobacter ginkgonis TaxID=1630594 RepID=A0ABP7DBR4_9MICC
MSQTLADSASTAAAAPHAKANPRSTTATKPSMRERAAALVPGIAARAQQVDADRVIHPDSIQELVDSGLTRAMQASAYGGEEADPADFIAAVVEIGKACASTAWVLCILGMHNWQLAHFEESLQEELFGEDPTTLISSSYSQQGTAQRVPGGYLVNGRWRTSSGVVHSQYAIVGIDVQVDGKPRAHDFVLNLEEVEVFDDWFVIGLRGTGSRSIIAKDLFVPENHAIDRDVVFAKLGPGLKRNDSALFRIDQGVLYATVAAAPALGTGWGFYTEFKRQISNYTRRTDQARIAEERTVLLRLADAGAALRDQESVVLGHMDKAYARAVAGEEYDSLELAEAIFDMSRTSRAALIGPQHLMQVLTASVVVESNPLQRMYRDLLTARQHGTQNVDLHGAAMMNLEMGNEAVSRFILSPARRQAAMDRAAQLYG